MCSFAVNLIKLLVSNQILFDPLYACKFSSKMERWLISQLFNVKIHLNNDEMLYTVPRSCGYLMHTGLQALALSVSVKPSLE